MCCFWKNGNHIAQKWSCESLEPLTTALNFRGFTSELTMLLWLSFVILFYLYAFFLLHITYIYLIKKFSEAVSDDTASTRVNLPLLLTYVSRPFACTQMIREIEVSPTPKHSYIIERQCLSPDIQLSSSKNCIKHVRPCLDGLKNCCHPYHLYLTLFYFIFPLRSNLMKILHNNVIRKL